MERVEFDNQITPARESYGVTMHFFLHDDIKQNHV